MKTLSTLAFAALAVSAIPATADDAAQSAFTAHLSANANAAQVRNLLRSKNYTNISLVDRDEDGRWVGTAVKNGKRTFVSVYLPNKSDAPAVN